MCTAITYKTNDFYFGRTLDYEFSFGEEIKITPRAYIFNFSNGKTLKNHYAIIGMAHTESDYPLYYDAVNEKGLCMAALNFVGNAYYNDFFGGKDNIAHFEFIPYILATCQSVKEARLKLTNINITNTKFSENLPLAQLHWIIADKNEAITVEAVKDGIKVYDNPIGVLTNNPPFCEQMFNLNNYMNLSAIPPKNLLLRDIKLKEYSRGLGAIGLPGDWSSQSRFVRAAFVKENSVSSKSETESVGQFFHILGSVTQIKGCCEVENGKYEITIYSSCCNADKGIYYYKTYQNHQIAAIDMKKEKLDSNKLIHYPLITENQIKFLN